MFRWLKHTPEEEDFAESNYRRLANASKGKPVQLELFDNTPHESYKSRVLVYVAGPFRADTAWHIEQNIREAEDVGAVLWSNGVSAIIPHSNSRYYHGLAADSVFIEGTLRAMAACDAVVVVGERWHTSEGTIGEIQEAFRLRIPVFFWEHDEGEFWQFCEMR